jgi:hypothetical protein
MAWIVSTVQSISLEEGAPELPGFFVGQSTSSAELLARKAHAAFGLGVPREAAQRKSSRTAALSLMVVSRASGLLVQLGKTVCLEHRHEKTYRILCVDGTSSG